MSKSTSGTETRSTRSKDYERTWSCYPRITFSVGLSGLRWRGSGVQSFGISEGGPRKNISNRGSKIFTEDGIMTN